MRITWQRIMSVIVLVGTAVSIGIWTSRGLSQVPTEDKPLPRFLQLLGHQTFGRNLLFSVYCDRERGHLLYTYTVAGGESPNGTLTVIKDGCGRGK